MIPQTKGFFIERNHKMYDQNTKRVRRIFNAIGNLTLMEYQQINGVNVYQDIDAIEELEATLLKHESYEALIYASFLLLIAAVTGLLYYYCSFNRLGSLILATMLVALVAYFAHKSIKSKIKPIKDSIKSRWEKLLVLEKHLNILGLLTKDDDPVNRYDHPIRFGYTTIDKARLLSRFSEIRRKLRYCERLFTSIHANNLSLETEKEMAMKDLAKSTEEYNLAFAILTKNFGLREEDLRDPKDDQTSVKMPANKPAPSGTDTGTDMNQTPPVNCPT